MLFRTAALALATSLASIAMVAGAWGRSWSLDDLAHRIPPGAKGIKLRVLRDLARTRGLEAYAIKATRMDLEHEWKAAGYAALVVVADNTPVRRAAGRVSVAADGQAPRVQRDARRAH